MSTIAINVEYSAPVNFTASFPPAQRIIAGNNSNPMYLRYAILTQDSLQMTYYTASVVIPIDSLYSAAFSASPALTYPPTILQQPANTSMTAPGTVSFTVTALSELALTYQWYVQSGSIGPFVAATSGAYTGDTTAALTASYADASTSSFNYFVYLSNSNGTLSSSVANLTIS